LTWSAEVNAGVRLGPTIVPASSTFERKPQRTGRGFDDPQTARQWVRKEALVGVRWIKVYNSMDPPSLKAIVETAREYGMRVCGHAVDVPPHRAAEIGMATIEHMVSIPLSCPNGHAAPPPSLKELGSVIAWRWKQVGDDDCRKLMETFKTHGTGWVPTLVATERMAEGGAHDGMAAADPSARVGLREALRRSAELAVYAHRIGVQVGVGTDFPIDGVEPGVSLHREMQLLVEPGGAKPLEALQMATIQAARILGHEALLGSIEAGKTANLVVLSANPHDDIRHTCRIEWVIHDGRRRRPGPLD
jgi:imidazolonepropionase-like amidohydrolase